MSRLDINQYPDGSHRLLVDGAQIDPASLELHMQAGEPSVLVVGFAVNATTFNGEAKIKIDDDTREFLIRLGWTPPAGD